MRVTNPTLSSHCAKLFKMRFVCIVVKNRLTKSALILTVHLTDPQDYSSCCVSLGHCAKASLNVLSSYKIKFINEIF